MSSPELRNWVFKVHNWDGFSLAENKRGFGLGDLGLIPTASWEDPLWSRFTFIQYTMPQPQLDARANLLHAEPSI